MHLGFCLTYGLIALAGNSDDQVTDEDLKLTVMPAKERHILYEPVVFRIALEYVGNEPMALVPSWSRSWGDIHVWLAARPLSEDERPPAEAEYRGSASSLWPPGVGQPRGPIKLHAEEPLDHVEAALWFRDYFVQRPGLLWIKARFRYARKPDRYVESIPLAVRFEEVPRSERHVLKLWASPEAGSVVQYGTALEKAQREKAQRDLETIVREYPESVYAFYAQLALSRPGHWAEVAFEGLRSLAPGAEPNLALVDRAEQLVAEREQRKRMLFPDDDRLAAQLRYDLDELAPLEELLEAATKQTEVPLQVGEPLQEKSWIISGRAAADEAGLSELVAQLGPEERIFIFRRSKPPPRCAR